MTAVIGADTAVATGSNPTVLLVGSTPSHRNLAIGDTGVDVLQLELNLVVLGFDPGSTVTVDDTYTYNTSLMVVRWQEANDATVAGEVAQRAVVYAPADRRVGAVHLGVGDVVSDGDPVLELTGLGREVVTVPESAHLRLDSGTHYVELATGGLVEVQPGASFGGWVEVNGEVAVDDLVVARECAR